MSERTDTQGSIHLDGLWKQYGDVDAVAGIDIEIASGEFFVNTTAARSGAPRNAATVSRAPS